MCHLLCGALGGDRVRYWRSAAFPASASRPGGEQKHFRFYFLELRSPKACSCSEPDSASVLFIFIFSRSTIIPGISINFPSPPALTVFIFRSEEHTSELQ